MTAIADLPRANAELQRKLDERAVEVSECTEFAIRVSRDPYAVGTGATH